MEEWLVRWIDECAIIMFQRFIDIYMYVCSSDRRCIFQQVRPLGPRGIRRADCFGTQGENAKQHSSDQDFCRRLPLDAPAVYVVLRAFFAVVDVHPQVHARHMFAITYQYQLHVTRMLCSISVSSMLLYTNQVMIVVHLPVLGIQYVFHLTVYIS